MQHNWNVTELKLLQKYDDLGNEIACLHPDLVSEKIISNFLALQAKLLMINKYVIGYLSGVALGIYAFNEALQLEDYYCNQGKIFMFVPIVKERSIL